MTREIILGIIRNFPGTFNHNEAKLEGWHKLMKLSKLWRTTSKRLPQISPPPPPGSSVEFVGLPGSGKHIVAPVVQSELFARGWHRIPPTVDFSINNDQKSLSNSTLFCQILEMHIKRLREDGCRAPYLTEYVRHTSYILSWSWN